MGSPNSLAKLYATAENPLKGSLAVYQSAVDAEARAQEEQGQLLLGESITEAQRREAEVESFQSEQASRYNASGVTLEGTPLQVLESTRQKGKAEIDALIRRGRAYADLASRQSFITRNQGRANILGQESNFRNQQTQQAVSALSQPGTFESLLKTTAGLSFAAALPGIGEAAGGLFSKVFPKKGTSLRLNP